MINTESLFPSKFPAVIKTLHAKCHTVAKQRTFLANTRVVSLKRAHDV